MVFQTLKFAVIFIVVMIIYLFIKRPEHFRWRDFLSCVWWVYVITLLLMVFQSDQPIGELPVSFRERIASGDSINLIPFRTIINFIRYGGYDDTMVNILGNILIFIPFGIGVVYLSNRGVSVKRNLIFCLLFPLFIETVQLFVGRNVDVDDVILNFIGGAIGVYIACGLAKISPFFRQLTQK
ncbi:MAG: VanZ family protein [Eubacteriaceae bacterium]|nr:VanZ family protein [Eubacteriaceae bacterium]